MNILRSSLSASGHNSKSITNSILANFWINLFSLAKPKEVEKPKEVAKPKEVEKPKEVAKPKEVEKPKEVAKPKEVEKPKEVAKPKEVEKPKEVAKPKEPEPVKKPASPKPVRKEEKKVEASKPDSPSTATGKCIFQLDIDSSDNMWRYHWRSVCVYNILKILWDSQSNFVSRYVSPNLIMLLYITYV